LKTLFPLNCAVVARKLLSDFIEGISLENYCSLLGSFYLVTHPALALSHIINKRLQRSTAAKERIRKMSENIMQSVSPEVRKRFLNKLSRRLNIFKKTRFSDSWTRYYDEIDEKFNKKTKLETVRNIIERINPGTVLDIGCNTGIFSIEAAQTGSRVIALDSSESCVEELYATAYHKNLPITPLIADIVNPTPAYGYLGKQYPDLLNRAGCEMVLFLGIMHHVHIIGRQSIERIVELLNILAQKHLVYEYIDVNDANMPHLPQRRSINYTIDTVKLALSKYYKNIETFPSDRQTRSLLLCTK